MSKSKKKKSPFQDFLNELKNSSVTSSKPVENIEERKYFLIVCEGEKTEPSYFNYFKNFLPRNLLETIEVEGEGDNTLNVVKKAIELRDKRNKDSLLPKFDEVWAVFDKDDFPAQRFNQAISLAERESINSGHSNQSFELWYVLHFQNLQSALHRKDYITILTKELGFKYEKNDSKVVQYLFNKCNISQAIQWAKTLDEGYQGITPSNSCPQTKVYKLVKSLLTYCNHPSIKEK